MRTLLLALALTAASASAQVLVPIMAGNERAATPTDSPGMGTYSSTQSVTLSDPTAATILYTTNGSTPACPATGTLYTGAFNISVTTTLKAIGCNGVTGGGVLTSVYTINPSLAVVNTAVGQDTTGTAATTIASSALVTTTGNLLVVGVRSSNGGAITCADTATNSYTSITDYNQGTAGDWEFCYAKNITGNAANVVTATLTGSAASYRAILVFQVSGANITTPLDSPTNVGGSTASGGSPQTYTSPTFTTANSSSIIFFGVNVGALSETWTAGAIGGVTATIVCSGASGSCAGANNPIAAVEYLIVSSIQTTITAAAQVSAGAPAAYGVAAFH